MSIWEALDKVFARTLYMQPIMVLLEITFIIVSIKYPIKKPHYRLLIIMTALFIVCNLYDFILLSNIILLNESTIFKSNYEGMIISVGIFFQFLCFTEFQKKSTNSRRLIKYITLSRSILIIPIISIIILAIYYPISTPLRISIFSIIFSSAELFAIPGSVVFFYELLWFKDYKNILHIPDFWIHVGILTLSIGGFPIHLATTLNKFSDIRSITDIIQLALYSLMFIIFTKGYLCQKFQQK